VKRSKKSGLRSLEESTQSYERWVARRLPVVPADLARKHALMGESPFALFRATFYRWVEQHDALLTDLEHPPEVLAVGDLHVENFGTWTDAEGRLVWGVNDFDEAAKLPYTNDLVRLGTSAALARAIKMLGIGIPDVSEAILLGYRQCLKRGGRPLVLEEDNHWLRDIATNALRDPVVFWKKMNGRVSDTKPPRDVASALEAAMPSDTESMRIGARVAGLGGLGRPRYVALGSWRGAFVAREARALLPSAVQWARGLSSRKPAYMELIERSVRNPDPFVSVRGRWLIRRLAPHCSRIDLDVLPKLYDEYRLMHAMGWETANVHLGTARPKTLLKHLRILGKSWLPESIERMAEALREDWKEF
jgi:hypothetical protein